MYNLWMYPVLFALSVQDVDPTRIVPITAISAVNASEAMHVHVRACVAGDFLTHVKKSRVSQA